MNKISKRLAMDIDYLVKYYEGDKDKVLVNHAKALYNEMYKEVNELSSLYLADLLINGYEIEKEFDFKTNMYKMFRFHRQDTPEEIELATLVGDYVVISWMSVRFENQTDAVVYSVEEVNKLVNSKEWIIVSEED